MKYKLIFLATIIINPINLYGQDGSWEELLERGRQLYFEDVSCWVCHGDNAEGRVGPSLQYGPSPMLMQDQLDSNPQMAVVVAELNPDIDDLIALASYISHSNGHEVTRSDLQGWQASLEIMAANKEDEDVDFFLTERDMLVMQIQDFQTVIDDWQRRAKLGSLKREYEVEVIETYELGDAKFSPEPNSLYFYENTGGTGRRVYDASIERTSLNQVVVGNATSREVITSGKIPQELTGAVHTTVLSPDGKNVYIIGPTTGLPQMTQGVTNVPAGMSGMAGMGVGSSVLRSTATLLKVDAFTLQPIKQLAVGGRMHHAQIFQDKYILIDTFVSDPDGLDIFLLDPATDKIIGGVKSEDLGGSNYTAFTDDEFIYVLMQPGNDGGSIVSAAYTASGQHAAWRPFWVAKIDPETWEVVAEYPYRGYRGDWIVIDNSGENIFVPAAGSANVTKVNTTNGAIEWSAAVGMGPYGATLNADETELWVANKGEGVGGVGRTITVIDVASGQQLETVFSGYGVDHVLLSPNGKEMWATSNSEGRIYVFDATTREQIKIIDMPNRGNAHGLVWVYYDEQGQGRVVRDQGNFHNGINPVEGLTVGN
jgi:DNA-binding beta-propeller fold protein YncE